MNLTHLKNTPPPRHLPPPTTPPTHHNTTSYWSSRGHIIYPTKFHEGFKSFNTVAKRKG